MTPHCVYRMYDAEGQLLYIGCTANPLSRLGAHSYTKPWWAEVARVELVHYATGTEAFRVEAEAIGDEAPRHNQSGVESAKRGWQTRKRRRNEAHSRGVRCFDAGCRCEGVAS